MTKAVNPTFRRPKGLLIDLDGTVLPKSNQPSNAVKAAITAASKIIPVAIASGRVQDDVCHYARLFGLTTLQIADNGATLIDPLTGCATIRRTFTKADAMHAVSILESIASRVLVCDAGRLVPLPKNITEWDVTVIMGEFPNESEAMHWEECLKSDTLAASASIDNVDKWYIDCTVAGVDKAYGAAEFASNIGI